MKNTIHPKTPTRHFVEGVAISAPIMIVALFGARAVESYIINKH